MGPYHRSNRHQLFAIQPKLNTMKVYGAFIFASLISSIFAQTDQQFDGACPIVKTQQNLDADKYAGEWYEIKRFTNTLVPGECGSADYEKTTHGFNIAYLSRDIPNKETSEIRMLVEKEVLKSPHAKYDVYYDCEKNKISHYILETDYTTYSIVWGCSENTVEGTENNIQNTQRLFIYSREKTLEDATMNKVIEVLKSFNIDHTQLKDVEQDDEKCGRNEEKPEMFSRIISFNSCEGNTKNKNAGN